MIKKLLFAILLALFLVFLGMQSDRPVKNQSDYQYRHFSTIYSIPDSVNAMLSAACYDCHSNKTRYPWYAEVQPAARFLETHVMDGRKHLNFSEFASYHPRRQFRKISEIEEMVKENEMPLPSYTLLHRDAILSPLQKEALYAWVNATKDSMKRVHHADSLRMRR